MRMLLTWRPGEGTEEAPSPRARGGTLAPRSKLGILLALAVLLAPLPAAAQSDAAAQAAGGVAEAPIPQEKLDSLVAPIALYPDQLLSQTLMAATYPLDVVEAARFVKANAALKGDALDKAVAEKKWDPSVQSLTAFPQVLDMMDKKLDWTQELGNAFLSDEARVLKTVQGLRQRAEAAGTLKSSEQLKVVKEQDVIVIQPAQPQVVYVPTYDPTYAYGAWPAPAYPPYYYQPPPAYYSGGAVLAAGLIGFGLGVAASDNHWGWSDTNWHGGSVNVNVNRNNTFVRNNAQYRASASGGRWQFNSAQRKGVAYGDAATRARYQNVNPNDVAARRGARGYAPGTAGGGQFAANQRAGGAAAGADRQAGARSRDAQAGGARDQRQAETRGGRQGAGTGGGRSQGADLGGGRSQGADLGGGRSQGAGLGGGRSQAGASRAGAQGAGGGFGGGSAGRSGFDPGQSRQQAQSFSSRGASSRASMGGGMRGGGGGGMRGGGGGRRGR